MLGLVSSTRKMREVIRLEYTKSNKNDGKTCRIRAYEQLKFVSIGGK